MENEVVSVDFTVGADQNHIACDFDMNCRCDDCVREESEAMREDEDAPLADAHVTGVR